MSDLGSEMSDFRYEASFQVISGQFRSFLVTFIIGVILDQFRLKKELFLAICRDILTKPTCTTGEEVD